MPLPYDQYSQLACLEAARANVEANAGRNVATWLYFTVGRPGSIHNVRNLFSFQGSDDPLNADDDDDEASEVEDEPKEDIKRKASASRPVQSVQGNRDGTQSHLAIPLCPRLCAFSSYSEILIINLLSH